MKGRKLVFVVALVALVVVAWPGLLRLASVATDNDRRRRWP